MQKETRLQEVLRGTLESLRDKEYSEETLRRYQKKFHGKRLALGRCPKVFPTASC